MRVVHYTYRRNRTPDGLIRVLIEEHGPDERPTPDARLDVLHGLP